MFVMFPSSGIQGRQAAVAFSHQFLSIFNQNLCRVTFLLLSSSPSFPPIIKNIKATTTIPVIISLVYQGKNMHSQNFAFESVATCHAYQQPIKKQD